MFTKSLYTLICSARKTIVTQFHKLFVAELHPLPSTSVKRQYERRPAPLSHVLPLSVRPRTMAVCPPSAVRGMTQLDTSVFRTTVAVPTLTIPANSVSQISKKFKKHILKMMGVKPVAGLEASHPLKQTHRLLLLDPTAYPSVDAYSAEERALLESCGAPLESSLELSRIQLGYENFRTDDILRAVLPASSDVASVSGFSLIGHIAHLNLREEHEPYKGLIGQVILDKVAQVRTVVNKLSSIDTTFRFFEMEVLTGEHNFVTVCKEHGVAYEMDFSKVYWNPRLSTEHQRIVGQLRASSTVFDVFAGIGPFAIPAAKKGCTVVANDLNPESYKWLVANAKRNKVNGDRFSAHNLDGREFIRQVVAPHYEQLLRSGDASTEVYVVMNLPALALDFLDALVGMLPSSALRDVTDSRLTSLLPRVRCYCFEKPEEARASIEARVRSATGHDLPPAAELRLVRNVAPNKDMFCVEFVLPADVMCRSELVTSSSDDVTFPSDDEPFAKKQKAE